MTSEKLDEVVEELITRILLGGPNAQNKAKLLLRDLGSMPLNAALEQETAARIARIRASAEGREGITAFLEKRQPSWQTDNA